MAGQQDVLSAVRDDAIGADASYQDVALLPAEDAVFPGTTPDDVGTAAAVKLIVSRAAVDYHRRRDFRRDGRVVVSTAEDNDDLFDASRLESQPAAALGEEVSVYFEPAVLGAFSLLIDCDVIVLLGADDVERAALYACSDDDGARRRLVRCRIVVLHNDPDRVDAACSKTVGRGEAAPTPPDSSTVASETIPSPQSIVAAWVSSVPTSAKLTATVT